MTSSTIGGKRIWCGCKWGLMAAILMCFFVLDALFLRAAGVGERWKLLVLIYAASGLVVVRVLGSGWPGRGGRSGI